MTFVQPLRDKLAKRIEETHQDLFRQRICWADALEMADAVLQVLPVDTEDRTEGARQIEVLHDFLDKHYDGPIDRAYDNGSVAGTAIGAIHQLQQRMEEARRGYKNAFEGRQQAWKQLERIALMCNAADRGDGVPDVEITQVDELVEADRDELHRKYQVARRAADDNRKLAQKLERERKSVEAELEALRKGKGSLRVGNLVITAAGEPERWQPESGQRVTGIGSVDTDEEGKAITGDYIGVCPYDSEACAMLREPYEPTPVHVDSTTMRPAMKGENA